MLRWYKIDRALDLKDKGIVEYKTGRKTICLTWYEEQLYAFSRKCPHAGAPLKNGWCEDGKVICPFHRHEFDLLSGKGSPGQHNFIHIYPVKHEANAYYIGIETSFWQSLFG
ncbi:Rieske (2Fe-2S) protein [Sphingobacterium thalpophilum]|uniref:Naphthalene 1,2-dioxygenase system ferredoxin subunit n=1 Tax=Sphingobacterium thalpophilum TaxID=259 RepID=A0A4U9VXU0_9SPHI|nr:MULTISPECIES: Rieske (2Fe-2S) protein [Sphingobacterium]MCW8311825.1 Rieske (2Fe-2S) protein [Sphingobacterium sp. InxBP1]VTR52490.1 Naphthalene 1,2-dioxygenase system ferredoxin subunit [Sphingobacterium thalpophilum]